MSLNEYFIRSKQTGLAMQIENDRVDIGTNIVMNEYTGANNQLWVIDTLVNGTIKSKADEKLCMAIKDGSLDQGTSVVLDNAIGIQSQTWTINVDVIHSSLNSRLVMKVKGGDTEPGTQIVTWGLDSTVAETFILAPHISANLE